MPPPQQMTDGNERNLVKTKTQWRKTLVTRNQDSCECWYLVDLSFPLSDHIFEMLPEWFYIEIGAQSDFAIFAFNCEKHHSYFGRILHLIELDGAAVPGL